MKKVIVIVFVLLLAAAAVAAYAYYSIAVVPVTPDREVTVTIPTGATYEQVLDSLAAQGIEPQRAVFDQLADRMAYRQKRMRPGRYELPPGMSALALIRRLRTGQRGTANVVLTTEREPMNVAAKVARFLEPDSLSIVHLLQDTSYLDSLGYTPQTIQTLFIPNTYELYWHASPREFMDRMVQEHDKFWSSNNRLQKAEALGLTPEEVYTLASIVEKESLVAAEQPVIAGVYLNRLERGILLQADPTSVFATRDFGTPRVLNRHIEFDSPYNTYMYAGLPPGPIAMPSVGSIDGVLNPVDHDYIFFCAAGDGSGTHNFAKTMGGHSRNIAIYVRNLRKRGLR